MRQSDLNHVIELTAGRILSRQQGDGSFSFCCEASPFGDAMMVVFLQLMGERDLLIHELCRSIVRKQHADGGWRAFPDQSSDVSVSTLAYFALLLSGYSKHTTCMARARVYLRDGGGVTKASNLVKILLAVAGQLSWNHLPNPHIEAALLNEGAPVNLYDFAAYARLHIPSFMVLSHLNFHYRVPERYSIKDLVIQKWAVPQVRILYKEEEALDRCRTFILQRLEPNGTLASYMTATILAVFALQALGYPKHAPIIQSAIRGLKDMVYHEGHFVHAQLFTSTIWDTALCVRALHTTRMASVSAAMQTALQYLARRQHTISSDWRVHARDAVPGGWGFSHVNTLFPDVDDTIAVLKAMRPYRKQAEHVYTRGLHWVIGMQNRDGGWSAFDRNCDKMFLEWLPINDLGRAMTDPSVPDITGRVLETLGPTRFGKGEHIDRAVRWLLKHQQPDGSWFGRWGITYIYGTCAALRGLRESGVEETHQAIQRARRWLDEVQHDDGGFGESSQSVEAGHYISLGHATASQTAWGLMAMMATSRTSSKPIDQAAEYLVNYILWGEGWKETYPTGTGVAKLAYLRYHSYPLVWPLMALSEYRDRFLQ